MKFYLLTVSALFISGCTTITKDNPVEVLVPVSQACLGKVPEEVVPLNKSMTKDEWNSNDVKQKSEYIGAQALALKNYTVDMQIAAKGCRPLKD